MHFPEPYPERAVPAAAGTHSDGLNDRGRFADITKNGYSWTRKKLPTPGALNYAFDTLALPELSPVGPGIGSVFFFNKTSVPLYVAANQVVTNGLGGLQAGQFVAQPLIDTYNNSYGR